MQSDALTRFLSLSGWKILQNNCLNYLILNRASRIRLTSHYKQLNTPVA